MCQIVRVRFSASKLLSSNDVVAAALTQLNIVFVYIFDDIA